MYQYYLFSLFLTLTLFKLILFYSSYNSSFSIHPPLHAFSMYNNIPWPCNPTINPNPSSNPTLHFLFASQHCCEAFTSHHATENTCPSISPSFLRTKFQWTWFLHNTLFVFNTKVYFTYHIKFFTSVCIFITFNCALNKKAYFAAPQPPFLWCLYSYSTESSWFIHWILLFFSPPTLFIALIGTLSYLANTVSPGKPHNVLYLR